MISDYCRLSQLGFITLYRKAELFSNDIMTITLTDYVAFSISVYNYITIVQIPTHTHMAIPKTNLSLLTMGDDPALASRELEH